MTISHNILLRSGWRIQRQDPMGVDVERFDQARNETILAERSRQEIGWLENMVTAKLKVATALWTAKSAFSRVLTTVV